MLKLYQNIKNRRIELDMSQQDLAEKVGYKGKSMISQVENGLVDLPLSMIIKFADALKCSPSYLMGWSSEEEKTIDRISNNLTSLSGGYDVFKNEHTKDKEFMEHIELLYSLPKDKRYKVYDYIKYQYYRSDEDAKEKESPLDA